MFIYYSYTCCKWKMMFINITYNLDLKTYLLRISQWLFHIDSFVDLSYRPDLWGRDVQPLPHVLHGPWAWLRDGRMLERVLPGYHATSPSWQWCPVATKPWTWGACARRKPAQSRFSFVWINVLLQFLLSFPSLSLPLPFIILFLILATVCVLF